MLFTIQAYLEDYLNKQNLVDTDGYAVHLANLYFYYRSTMDVTAFLRKVRRIRTVIFVNSDRDRAEFEKVLVDRLDRRFKKKAGTYNPAFPGGTEFEKKKLHFLLHQNNKYYW